MNMRKIGLCSISTNHRAKEHIARASAIIESIGIECFSFFVDERCDESADIVVALGGDGTILRSKKYAKQHGVPVLGGMSLSRGTRPASTAISPNSPRRFRLSKPIIMI